MKTIYRKALVFSFLLLAYPVFSQTVQTSTNETTSVTAESQIRDGDDGTDTQDGNIRPNTPVDSIEDSINSDSQNREDDNDNVIEDSNIQPNTPTDNLEDSIASSPELRDENGNPQTSDEDQQAAERDRDETTQQIRDSLNESQMDAAATTPAIDISHTVQLVPQMTGVSCWAASAAMVVGWRDQISIDPLEIANGGVWRQYYYNGGLPPDNVDMLVHWRLRILPNQTRTVEGFAQILEVSPLWVATDLTVNDDGVPNGHIVVVSAMRGDGTPDGTLVTIYDPWEQGMRTYRPSNRGSIYTETYTEFVARQERLVNDELDRFPNALYIAH